MKKFSIISVITILLIIVVFSIVASSCTVVDSSEIGIKFKKLSLNDQGELDAVPVSGWVFYNPFTTSIFTYETYIQRVDYKPFAVTTKDAATFIMDPILAYQLRRDKAIYVFSKYRKPLKDIEAGYMRTAIYDAYRISANKYASDELMAKRAEFEADVRAMLEESLNKEGFSVEEFTSQIQPPASLQEAINAKNAAIQAALKAENEVKKAEADAKIAIAKAKGDGEAAIAKAKGDGEAMKIRADAEAYYNKVISESLSTFIVQEDWIEKWDGRLPTYQGGGSDSHVFSMPMPR